MADVTYQHEDYTQFAERAQVVDDVCGNLVKKQGDKYLPRPNPTDKSAENKARFTQYLLRAIFHNFTGYTRRGLVGAAFTKTPELIAPTAIEYISDDIDGAGNSIFQQSRSVVSKVLAKGRNGLLVDYPQTNGSATRAEMAQSYIRASTLSIDATRIINWKTTLIGGKHVLSLVVYKDDAKENTADGFGVDTIEQYRALRLIDGVYTVELWRRKEKNKDEWFLFDDFTPTRGNGSTWNIIPFIFVGAENNDPGVDMAPLYDLAELNIGHYRNSADYEDNVFFCGQAQPWASGIDQAHMDMINEAGLVIGSRTLFPVPDGGQFGFAQAQPNTQVREAMQDKKADMASMGARILTPGGAVKTATEAQADNETEHSILSLVVSNASEAYTQCLGWMLEFMNASGEASYTINQEFTKPHIDAQKLTALVGALQSGKYPEGDFWAELRRSGLIDPSKDDETIKAELDSQDTGLGLDDGAE